jgi:ABC-2 type transport system permease protein
MFAIYKKELKQYFNTVTGYAFLGFMVLITGYFFVSQNIAGANSNYNETLVGSLIMFLILMPVLTMRSFAEESRQKTDQLLFTSPVKVPEIVAAKFLSAVTLYLIGIAITFCFPVVLSQLGTSFDWSLTFGGIIGYFLMGACLISVGIFISVLTDNQIVAAATTFAAIFLLLMMDNIASSAPISTASSIIFAAVVVALLGLFAYNSTKQLWITLIFVVLCYAFMGVVYFAKRTLYDGLISKTLGYFSVLTRFENFYMGVISLSDVVYYITFSAVFLYLTVNVIEKRRWS